MMVRRADDRRLRLVLARPTGWISGGELPARRAARRSSAPETMEMRDGLPEQCQRGESLVLLLDGPDGEGVLVTGAVAGTVPQGSDNPDLMDRAAVGASVFLREKLRTEKRQRLPDQLIGYFEELNVAESEDAVWRALATHALRIVGAHTAMALVRDHARGLLRAPASSANADPREYRPCILWDDRFLASGLVLSEDARRGGGAECAAPLFGDPSTALLAHVPVSGDGVLVLTERREERIFEPEDWDVLRALALQAEMALRRVRLIDSVRSLSLTDPLTGLGNRRHMEVVMEHAWSAARRGEPLVVMALDLDGFKEVNDTRGHEAGDAMLCSVAAALRAEARGSDVLVRHGGDEFLVILPGSTVEGAHALADRVRRRLDGAVGISAGIASYAAEHESPECLIREADRRLYEAKARGRSPIS